MEWRDDLSMSDAELRDPIEVIHPTHNLTWREQLRLVWRTPIVIAAVIATAALIYPVGFYRGTSAVTREKLNQKRGWEVQVATYNECFNKFVKSIPRSAMVTRQARSEACLDVAEVAMDERYKAARR